ncbi:MAG: aminotransferase class III-fold pyridoxal phosphate-dependent enzyme [Planctomycetota bacterium]|nr:aminotransferase class III-fold pyridoxal phosphate-dependent enzyme [Planctomycetota bacterium]
MRYRNVDKSMKLFERACELIPGGTQLISRRPTRFACGVSPVYAERATGSRFWDIDGNEFIDWVSGIGAIILGYCDGVVDRAVCEQISKGTMYSINHELEVELAEELVKTIPCAEMVRYAKGGGEACAIAVRIARGATGRDKILFCGYHGWHDWYLAANLRADASLDAHLFPGIDPTGVPKCLAGTAIPFPYGDLDALGNSLDDHRGEVAAVIMEPFRTELPPDGYLAGVAKLAREHDVILIFDEVSTGFRPTASGAQPLVGVTPDMAVFAKSISNGYPMGAVVGRRDVMEAAGQMFISSTYWSDTIGLRAALTTLREVRRRDVPKIVRHIGTTLQAEITAVARETGLPARCEGLAFHPHLTFETTDLQQHSQLSTLFIQEMAKRGCHGYTSFYLNAAQTGADIEQTITAAREAFQIMVRGRDQGRLDELLECQQQVESFRRLVR